jgi:hypothetical protein
MAGRGREDLIRSAPRRMQRFDAISLPALFIDVR